MFTHVMLGSNDMTASQAFYDALFATLGASPAVRDDKGRLVYFHGGAMFMVTTPIDGQPACHANGGTVGFAMTSAEQADAWHAAGVAAGGASCEDPPGLRDSPIGPLYLAYLRDPAGNKLCGVYRPA